MTGDEAMSYGSAFVFCCMGVAILVGAVCGAVSFLRKDK